MISEKIKKNANMVNKQIHFATRGQPKSLYDAACHIIANGGKRLRPYMVIKSCSMLGGKKTDAMPSAIAIEMVHNFTLVHDDIMDNDEVRHGVPTVHKKFGLSVAILAGDVLFSKAFEMVTAKNIAKNRSADLSSRLAKACTDVCEGQMLDIGMAESKSNPTQSQYIKMIRKKTSALFEAACAMGAISAGAKPRDVANLASFGSNLGVAFQITDDIIGVMGDSSVTKKPVGNDIREGKKSLPILIALKKSKGANRRAITKCFGNKNATKKDLKMAVSAVRSSGAQEDSKKIAKKYSRAATKSLLAYSGRSKEELVGLLDLILEREE